MNNIGLEIIFWTVLTLYLLTRIGLFKMKIFLDSAITTDIQDRLPTELIDGVTTTQLL